MSTQTIPVPTTGIVVPIYPAGLQPPQTLYNSGANTIFINDAQSPGAGYPLSPGSTLTWDAQRSLYASCVVGAPSTLIMTENSGNVFDASAIAGQIIDQGLAADIAAQILATGVQLIDVPTVFVANENTGVLPNGNVYFFGDPLIPFDTTKVQTLAITYSTNGTTPTGVIEWRLVWYNETTLLEVEEIYTYAHSDVTIRVPAKFSGVLVQLKNISGGNGASFTVTILGSQRPSADITVSDSGVVGDTTAAKFWVTVSTFAGPRIIYLPVRSGRVSISLVAYATVGATTYVRTKLYDGKMLKTSQVLAIGQNELPTFEAILPAAPCHLEIAGNASGLEFEVVVTWLDTY